MDVGSSTLSPADPSAAGARALVLVTGGTGFVGAALVARLATDGRHVVRATTRTAVQSATVPHAEFVGSCHLSETTSWQRALQGVNTVIHTAARVHVMRDAAASPLAEFRRVNVDGTIALARQAADAGVRRFVFVSSIKVNGEATRPGAKFSADNPPAPVDAYGVSKLEAELALHEISRATLMEVVVVRPPLVYGPGVGANFRSILRWLGRGVPLPFGAIDNRRSIVALDNLVDLLITCIDHPAAAAKTFLVSDGHDLSTTELLRRCAKAMGRPARLLPVPVQLIDLAARCLGRAELSRRLCGSLQVDISQTRRTLDWAPPVATDDALVRTAQHFLAAKG